MDNYLDFIFVGIQLLTNFWKIYYLVLIPSKSFRCILEPVLYAILQCVLFGVGEVGKDRFCMVRSDINIHITHYRSQLLVVVIL